MNGPRRLRCREYWHDSLRSGLLSLPVMGSSSGRFLGVPAETHPPESFGETVCPGVFFSLDQTSLSLYLSISVLHLLLFFSSRVSFPFHSLYLCVLWVVQTVARREVIISLNHLIISANYSPGIFGSVLTSVPRFAEGGVALVVVHFPLLPLVFLSSAGNFLAFAPFLSLSPSPLLFLLLLLLRRLSVSLSLSLSFSLSLSL